LERNSFVTETDENFFFAAATSGGVEVRDDGVGMRAGTALAGAAALSLLSASFLSPSAVVVAGVSVCCCCCFSRAGDELVAFDAVVF